MLLGVVFAALVGYSWWSHHEHLRRRAEWSELERDLANYRASRSEEDSDE